MSYKTYNNYKDSNIDWINKIPSNWSISRVKNISLIKSGESPKFNDNGKYEVIGANGKIGKTNRFNVSTNHIIIGRVGASGSVNISPEFAFISDNAFIVTLNKHVDLKYSFYLFKSLDMNRLINKNAQPLLTASQIKNLFIPHATLNEQKQIANYLDKKTAKINKTISKNKKLIELLEEKRTALINEVVTKGLNPDAPMKDSGVMWIGVIPEHWELKRLKYNCEVNPSNRKSVSNENLKINFLPMEKVSEDGSYDSKSMAFYNKISKGYTYFEDNDVLVAKITPCFENGKSALLKNLKYGFGFGSTEFHVLRFKENILPEFIYYLIKSYAFRTIGQAFMHGTAGQKRVGTDFIENYLMATPPIDEQIEIIEYLNDEINKLTEVIYKINENINLLEEYKTSLIHHVVTGKVDVRGEEI